MFGVVTECVESAATCSVVIDGDLEDSMLLVPAARLDYAVLH